MTFSNPNKSHVVCDKYLKTVCCGYDVALRQVMATCSTYRKTKFSWSHY